MRTFAFILFFFLSIFVLFHLIYYRENVKWWIAGLGWFVAWFSSIVIYVSYYKNK